MLYELLDEELGAARTLIDVEALEVDELYGSARLRLHSWFGQIETVLHRELFNRETELKKESSRIIKEAGKITDYETYNKQFTDFLDEYNELGVSALAQYVQHRRIILDFLERAINLPPDKKNYPLEKVVHHLVYPMQHNSDDIPYSEQNLWMIDERLTYHSFVSSESCR